MKSILGMKLEKNAPESIAYKVQIPQKNSEKQTSPIKEEKFANKLVLDTQENRSKLELAFRSLSTIHPGLVSRYQLRIHGESGKLQIHVINGDTGETIEEIPSNKLLEFYGALEDLSSILIEKRA